FLGYGYEDPNIWAIFERISSFLTTGKKAMYFVAPGQKQDKIDFLSRKQIEYLDYTGATFLEKLTDRIKEHIFKDLEDGIVGPETFRAFTRANNAAVSLDSADQGFKLGTIKGIDGNEAHWNAQFTYPKNSDYSERHEAFFNSNKLLELVLTAEELLTFKMSVQGMKLMDKDSLAHLSIKKTPRIIEYDLSFLTEGLEFNGLKADVYTANQSIRMLTKLHSLSIEINLHFNGSSDVASTWNMEHAENYGSVQQEIEVYSFIIHLFRQKKFTIFFKNGGSHSSVSPQGNSRYADDAEFYLNYFKGLKKVEQAFGIKFRDFWGIDNSSFHSLEWLLKVIEGEPFDRQGDYPIEYEEIEPQMLGYFEQLEEPGVSDHPLEMTMNTNKSVTLHGLNLPVPGYHIVIPQASVKNLDELKTGETKRIVFFSRTGTMQEYFRIEPYRQATE
ncbi:MAG TPA: hypothetical protein VFE53_05695, partial [Mucilaginibacter sp.]|nr:hypothetical protein [Mucilaginibacter sp.]